MVKLRHLVAALGVAFSAGGLIYAFSGVDLRQVASEIRNLRVWPFCLSQAFFLTSVALRAVRWRWLLFSFKPLPFGSVFGATVVGMMANNVLPARMGELPRALFLARRERLSSTSILANIVAERIADVSSLLVLLGVYLAFAGPIGEDRAIVGRTGWIVLTGILGLVTTLTVATRFESHVVKALRAAVRPFSASLSDRITGLASRFVLGLNVFHGWGHCAAVIGLSHAIWLCGVASFFYIAESLSLHLTFLDALLVFVIVLFGIALPSAPGFVGTFHAFCVAALGLVGVADRAVASAYATVVHGTGWIVVNMLGAYFLIRLGRAGWRGLLQVGGDPVPMSAPR